MDSEKYILLETEIMYRKSDDWSECIFYELFDNEQLLKKYLIDDMETYEPDREKEKKKYKKFLKKLSKKQQKYDNNIPLDKLERIYRKFMSKFWSSDIVEYTIQIERQNPYNFH